MHEIEKQIMLRQLDSHWKEHIGALDYLRQGIHLRGYAQRNPKQEYKREAFEMFSSMLERVKHDTISILSKIQIRRPEDVAGRRAGRAGSEHAAVSARRGAVAGAAAAAAPEPRPSGAAQPDPRMRPPPPAGAGRAVRARGAEGRPQRPVPVRLRQEIQAVPRPPELTSPFGDYQGASPVGDSKGMSVRRRRRRRRPDRRLRAAVGS